MSSKDDQLVARIRRLEDRAELGHLVHEYARVFDEGDHDAMADLFTEDARIDYGPALGGVMHGRDAIRAWLRGIYLFAKTSHHVSNHQIWFEDDDAARGVCYVLAWHEWSDDRPNSVLYGRYEDRYLRTSEGWRIAERREVQHGAEHFDIEWNWIERSNAS
jgi:3-phenylpropionate/cinnamic acid dioxygenase small subunit